MDESQSPPDKRPYLKCPMEKSEISVFNENKYQHLFDHDTLPIVGFEWCINHVHKFGISISYVGLSIQSGGVWGDSIFTFR